MSAFPESPAVKISGAVGIVAGDIVGGSKNEIGVQVQVNGDYNTVTICADTTTLTLDQLHLHKLYDAPRKEIDFLLTNLRTTECVGRDSDIAALKSWLDEPEPISVRCLTGAAGCGKTRIAIELCDEASQGEQGNEQQGTEKQRNEKRWVAGFATHRELKRFLGSQNFTSWKWPEPILVVVDDAATCCDVLRLWLMELVRRIPDASAPKLRLLLLERVADARFGWWMDLVSPAGLSSRSPADLMSPRNPVELPGLVSADDRRALLSQVTIAVAKFRNVDPPQLPSRGAAPAFDQRLAEDTIDNEPLYLVMAGIIGVIEGTLFAFSLSRNEMASYISRVEADRIKRIAVGRNVDEEFLSHLVACIILQGGCDLGGLKQILAEERLAEYRGNSSDAAVLDTLVEILPLSKKSSKTVNLGDPVGIEAMQPDLIGEAFLLMEIARRLRSENDQLAIVERAWRRAPDGVRVSVLNTQMDFWRGEPTNPSAIWRAHIEERATQDFEARLAAGEMSPDAAVQLIWKISFTMHQWLRLTEFLLPFIDRLSPMRLGAFAAQRAIGAVETGNYEYGLQFADEILRNSAFPAYWRPELLNVQGRCLFHLGRYEDAAKIYRSGIEAAEANHPLIAQLYTNLGNALHADHQYHQKDVLSSAIEALEKGVELADNSLLEVEARASLSGALIEGKELNRAEHLLEEAWSLAQDKRSVSHKARMMVIRNRGVIDLLRGHISPARTKFDVAIDFAKAHFGPCHVEVMDLHKSVFLYLAEALKPPELMERTLRVLASVQTTCGILSKAAEEFSNTAELMTQYAIARAGLQSRIPEIVEIVQKQAGTAWDETAIESCVKFFRS
jgi:tetratricopeptide (TPR) repeat protein